MQKAGVNMERITGKGVSGGIAIGKISIYKRSDNEVKKVFKDNSKEEIKRFSDSRQTAKEELDTLYDKALREVGRENAAIFEVHKMMIDDFDYIESVENIINTQKVNAEYAVARTSDKFYEMFQNMEDEYMKARAADIKDISDRLIRVLGNCNELCQNIRQSVIVAAEDLSPSETVSMDKNKVLAFVTKYGSSNSHTAILAKMMNIPALTNVNYGDIDGKTAIVDGYQGLLIVEPHEEELEKYIKKQEEEKSRLTLLKELKGRENITSDGRKIDIYANIGGVQDIEMTLENDAGGIGLFRSEFLYLGNNDYPTEEEQFNAYKTVAENMADKSVIIRTLDIGADKRIGYFNLKEEDNPAMGLRAIRICLKRKDIFKTQLRAILRASAYGNISIMYPMIISLEEIREIKKIAEEVKDELKAENIPYKDVKQGIMIETPAAVMISEELGREVDFFSIGTNDLTQYTLAIDRQNDDLSDFYNPHHPAVLKMIKMVVENGHKTGCLVGICGELAADTTLTKEFVDMGVDELSVSPSFVLKVREAVRNI